MVDLAIKILSVLAGIWAAFASYPWLSENLVDVLALIGAIAVGVLAGALFYALANWVFANLKTPRV